MFSAVHLMQFGAIMALAVLHCKAYLSKNDSTFDRYDILIDKYFSSSAVVSKILQLSNFCSQNE